MNTPVTRIRLRRRPRIFGAYGIALLLFIMFLLLGFALQEPFVQAFDQALIEVMRGNHNEPLHAAAQFFDFLGSTKGFALVTLLFTGFFLFARRWFEAVLIIAAAAGAWGLNTAAKLWFARPRPELDDALFAADGLSYPSGNATIGIALFSIAAVLLAREARPVWARGVILAAAVLFILALGLFRVYAGVHYPTDIVGGFLLGGSYFLVLNHLHTRRR